MLRAEPEGLFALMDAARDPRVREVLAAHAEEHASLFEGEEGRELAEVAPYLVRLPAGSPLLEALVREGWGRSWGVYVTSKRPLREVRRHFRRFIMVRDESGRVLYFRFYDPRVLRVFLPACTPRQTSQLFEDITAVLLEDKAPGRLLRFDAPTPGGAARARVIELG